MRPKRCFLYDNIFLYILYETNNSSQFLYHIKSKRKFKSSLTFLKESICLWLITVSHSKILYNKNASKWSKANIYSVTQMSMILRLELHKLHKNNCPYQDKETLLLQKYLMRWFAYVHIYFYLLTMQFEFMQCERKSNFNILANLLTTHNETYRIIMYLIVSRTFTFPSFDHDVDKDKKIA